MLIKRKSTCALAAIVTTATIFISTGAVAKGLDGSSNIVCAVTDVVACVDELECVQGNTKKFDLPEIIIVDTQEKVVRAAYESGHKATSPVKILEINGDHLILQGVEESRGWTMAINSKTGKMNGSGVGDSLGFLLSGRCTAL